MESPFRAHPACQQVRDRPAKAGALKLRTLLGSTLAAPVPLPVPASPGPHAHSTICRPGVWGVCRPTVHTQGILCARKICSHLQIMSFSLHGCISSSSEVWEDLLIEQQTSSYNLILLFLPFYHFFSHVPLSTGSDKWRLEDTLGTCSKQSQPRLCRTLWTEKPQALQG